MKKIKKTWLALFVLIGCISECLVSSQEVDAGNSKFKVAPLYFGTNTATAGISMINSLAVNPTNSDHVYGGRVFQKGIDTGFTTDLFKPWLGLKTASESKTNSKAWKWLVGWETTAT